MKRGCSPGARVWGSGSDLRAQGAREGLGRRDCPDEARGEKGATPPSDRGTEEEVGRPWLPPHPLADVPSEPPRTGARLGSPPPVPASALWHSTSTARPRDGGASTASPPALGGAWGQAASLSQRLDAFTVTGTWRGSGRLGSSHTPAPADGHGITGSREGGPGVPISPRGTLRSSNAASGSNPVMGCSPSSQRHPRQSSHGRARARPRLALRGGRCGEPLGQGDAETAPTQVTGRWRRSG